MRAPWWVEELRNCLNFVQYLNSFISTLFRSPFLETEKILECTSKTVCQNCRQRCDRKSLEPTCFWCCVEMRIMRKKGRVHRRSALHTYIYLKKYIYIRRFSHAHTHSLISSLPDFQPPESDEHALMHQIGFSSLLASRKPPVGGPVFAPAFGRSPAPHCSSSAAACAAASASALAIALASSAASTSAA